MNWYYLLRKILRTIFIGAFCLLFVLPLIWMVSSSLKPNIDVFEYPIKWIPTTWRIENYIEIWTSDSVPFALMYFNSIKVTILTIIGKMIVSSSAAYAFSKMKFPIKNVVFVVFLGTMMIPAQVTVLPSFVLFNLFGIYNTHYALIIPALFDVSAIFLLRHFYDAIPKDLSESAFIDGAGHFLIWTRIIMPLTKAAMTSLAILTLVASWNNYFGPLIYLVDQEKFTLSLGIAAYRSEATLNLGLAASVSAIVPILLLYIFGQRYFEQSITSSGIKE